MPGVSSLAERRARSSGARPALIEAIASASEPNRDAAPQWADYLLTELWMRGFKIVPLEDHERTG